MRYISCQEMSLLLKNTKHIAHSKEKEDVLDR